MVVWTASNLAFEPLVVVLVVVCLKEDSEPVSVVDALLDSRIFAAVLVFSKTVDNHKVIALALTVSGLQIKIKALHQQRTVAVWNKNVLKADSNDTIQMTLSIIKSFSSMQ